MSSHPLSSKKFPKSNSGQKNPIPNSGFLFWLNENGSGPRIRAFYLGHGYMLVLGCILGLDMFSAQQKVFINVNKIFRNIVLNLSRITQQDLWKNCGWLWYQLLNCKPHKFINTQFHVSAFITTHRHVKGLNHKLQSRQYKNRWTNLGCSCWEPLNLNKEDLLHNSPGCLSQWGWNF